MILGCSEMLCAPQKFCFQSERSLRSPGVLVSNRAGGLTSLGQDVRTQGSPPAPWLPCLLPVNIQ